MCTHSGGEVHEAESAAAAFGGKIVGGQRLDAGDHKRQAHAVERAPHHRLHGQKFHYYLTAFWNCI